jgi:hypothetical protein
MENPQSAKSLVTLSAVLNGGNDMMRMAEKSDDSETLETRPPSWKVVIVPQISRVKSSCSGSS